MTTDATAAANNTLSIEEAVANLDALETENPEAPETPAAAPTTEGTNTEAEPAAEDADEPETVAEGEEAETEEADAEGEQPVQPALTPPRFWDAEDKDAFGKLSREDQERILKYDALANKATAEALEKTAAVRKSVEAEASKLTQLTGVLDKLLPEAQATFKSRWEGVDWDRVIQEQGAEQALILQNQMNREKEHVQQLQAAKNETDRVQTQKFVAERFEKLKAIVPELADDKAGAGRQLGLVKYISTQTSIPPAHIIERASAEELSIAYKAMKWDEAQANTTTLAQTKPKPVPPARPAIRATATPGAARSPQSARIKALQSKANPSIDELVELMDLQET